MLFLKWCFISFGVCMILGCLTFRHHLAFYLYTYDPTSEEEYFDDINPDTFVLDDSIWATRRHSRPGLEYYRSLQVAYKKLYGKYKAHTLYDVPQLLEEFNDLLAKYNEVVTQNAKFKAENDYYKLIMDKFIESKNTKKSAIESVVDRDEDKRFKSKTEYGQIAKGKALYVLKRIGWNDEQIADQISISEASVKPYWYKVKKCVQESDIRINGESNGKIRLAWSGAYSSDEEDYKDLLPEEIREKIE